MTDAEISGIMGWRGPGCYTEAQMRKVRQCIEQAVAPYREDAERLDWLASEYIKVDPFDMPTGADDSDVGWRLSQYRMGNPSEVVIEDHYKDDLRAAIDAARKGGV